MGAVLTGENGSPALTFLGDTPPLWPELMPLPGILPFVTTSANVVGAQTMA